MAGETIRDVLLRIRVETDSKGMSALSGVARQVADTEKQKQAAINGTTVAMQRQSTVGTTSAQSVLRVNSALSASFSAANRGVESLTRGMALLGAAGSQSAQQMLRTLLVVEGVIQSTRGLLAVVKDLGKAYQQVGAVQGTATVTSGLAGNLAGGAAGGAAAKTGAGALAGGASGATGLISGIATAIATGIGAGLIISEGGDPEAPVTKLLLSGASDLYSYGAVRKATRLFGGFAAAPFLNLSESRDAASRAEASEAGSKQRANLIGRLTEFRAGQQEDALKTQVDTANRRLEAEKQVLNIMQQQKREAEGALEAAKGRILSTAQNFALLHPGQQASILRLRDRFLAGGELSAHQLAAIQPFVGAEGQRGVADRFAGIAARAGLFDAGFDEEGRFFRDAGPALRGGNLVVQDQSELVVRLEEDAESLAKRFKALADEAVKRRNAKLKEELLKEFNQALQGGQFNDAQRVELQQAAGGVF